MERFCVDGRERTFATSVWRGAGSYGRMKKYIANAKTLAQAGFYSRPVHGADDNVCCYLCHKSLDGWEPEDDAWSEHVRHAPHCPLVTLDSESSRIATFTYQVAGRNSSGGSLWPHVRNLSPKAMARAGFYYYPRIDNGEDDTCYCFQCGLALDGWESEDDPSKEHAKRRPECPFVKGQMVVRPCSFECLLASKPEVHAVKHISASSTMSDSSGSSKFVVPSTLSNASRRRMTVAPSSSRRETMSNRRGTLSSRRGTLSSRRETLSNRRETLKNRKDTLNDRRDILNDRRETLKSKTASQENAENSKDIVNEKENNVSQQQEHQKRKQISSRVQQELDKIKTMIPEIDDSKMKLSDAMEVLVQRKLSFFDAQVNSVLSSFDERTAELVAGLSDKS